MKKEKVKELKQLFYPEILTRPLDELAPVPSFIAYGSGYESPSLAYDQGVGFNVKNEDGVHQEFTGRVCERWVKI